MSDDVAVSSHRDVVALIGNGVLAAGINVAPTTVASWRARNSIPGDRFVAVAEFAALQGYSRITVDLLARMAAGLIASEAAE